jgi:DNA-binding XRE family transcriptional regulator
MTLAQKLLEARCTVGLPREAVAASTGLRTNSLLRLELGYTPNPHWFTVVVLARYYGLDLNELAGPDEVAA